MTDCVEGGGHPQVRVLARQGGDPLAHPAARPVDPDVTGPGRAPTWALASRISSSVASRTRPTQTSIARSARGRLTGRLISMALASVEAFRPVASMSPK